MGSILRQSARRPAWRAASSPAALAAFLRAPPPSSPSRAPLLSATATAAATARTHSNPAARRAFTSSPRTRQQDPPQPPPPPPPPPHFAQNHARSPPKKVAPLTLLTRSTNITGRPVKIINLEIDGQFVSLDSIFLRDACRCPRCLDPSTQQKLFRTADIPNDVFPRLSRALDNGALRIDGWVNDLPTAAGLEPHVSVYDIDFLRQYSELRHRLRRNYNDRRYVLWDAGLMGQDVLWIDYDDYMTSDVKLFEAVRHLTLYGLLFLRGVPETPGQDAVEGIAERVGNIRNTFYGKSWDVRSVKDSKNIAYTSLDLGLHMDLLYFESPPGLQFLHCIRNSVTGGSSLFADSFRAATAVRYASDNLFRSLCTFPVPFHYKNDGHHYHYTRPTVVLEQQTYLTTPRLSHVNWAPPFQAPFEAYMHVEQNAMMRQYLNAARTMAASLDDPANVWEMRLREGECAVFMNRRVVHGRREFDPASGQRWLKGAYVDVDAFLSKYRVLSERFSQRDQGKVREYGYM